MLKVEKGVCFTLKSLNETLLLFTHLTSLCENRPFGDTKALAGYVTLCQNIN